MDPSGGSDIETAAPPAVSSLRSRFEQLTVEKTSTPANKGRFGSRSPGPSSPRPRDVSGSQLYQLQDGELRAATAPSDLKTGIKRAPPPPPPPRTPQPTAATRPALSPLLRPVPTPSSPSINQQGLPVISPRVVSQRVGEDNIASPSSGGVAALRNKFVNSPTSSPPRISAPTATYQSTGKTYGTLREGNALGLRAPPMIPPRRQTSSDSFLKARSIAGPSYSNHNIEQLLQPGNVENFSEDSDSDSDSPGIVSPPLPPRHPRTASGIQLNPGGFSSSSSLSLKSNGSDAVVHATPKRPLIALSPTPPPRPLIRRETSFEPPIPASPTETDAHVTPRRPLIAISPTPPPRPLIRRETSFEPPIPASSAAPPLPSRRGTAAPVEETLAPFSPAPRIPPRPTSTMPVVQTGVRASGLPRPPTRTIGLGEKLPPVRRPAHDSSDEEEPPQEPTEMLPDTSHTSRRPPTLRCFQYNDAYIPVPGGHGFAIAAGGTVVVASHHHVSVFYLSTSRTAISNWSTSQLHMKDAKLTCMEFRHASTKDERGTIVWIGTKEGHLFELDLQKGEVIGSKRHAHGHNYVSHIFRYGRSMLTFDESGKVLIFTPEGSRDVSLEGFPPRVFRIPEKQEFMKMIGGLLWTSTRADMGRSSFGTTPIIRIHDVFAPGSVPCAVQPPDAAGAVTSGAILPSSPHMVYLGHDNGYVSVWSIAENEGLPHCIEVLKVSATGIVSLEGVNDRIWAGGRMGAITVYDVTSRPWTVTNCWAAHKQAPVQQLFVDPLSIERIGRLSVVSIGKDQEVKLWDGLLSADWIDMELTKREAQFSTFRPLKVLIVSWNIDAALPEHLTGDPINNQFLFDVLDSVHSPDIISFGFQETVDLENHKGNLQKALRGHRSRSYEDGRVGQHLNPEYKVWQQKLESVVRQAMPQETPYTVIETEGLVGLYSCILVKRIEKVNIDDVGMAIVKRGFAKKYGNKGAIFVRLTIDDTSICIANCHLAAGQGKVQARNSDIQAMFEQEELLPQASTFEDPLAYVGGGDGTMLLDHEVVFFHGDMNYRISKTRESIITAVEAQDLASLLPYDQLSKEMKANSGFRLRSFSEGPLTFAPTYKYDRKSSEYDTSAKNRPPAWCDRILWRGQVPERVQQLHYRRWEADCSDHRPISAAFTMTVKSVNQQMRLMVKAEVATAWTLHQQLLVGDAEQFYEKQGLLCTIF